MSVYICVRIFHLLWCNGALVSSCGGRSLTEANQGIFKIIILYKSKIALRVDYDCPTYTQRSKIAAPSVIGGRLKIRVAFTHLYYSRQQPARIAVLLTGQHHTVRPSKCDVLHSC